ncbi:MAG TPA: Hpt domain-containing protein [Pantanalinema sp.]
MAAYSRPGYVATVRQALASLIPLFMENRQLDVQTLRVALAKHDLATVRRVGHNLAGMGSTFGFPAITDCGRSLERAAKASDAAELSRLISVLEDYIARVEIRYIP